MQTKEGNEILFSITKEDLLGEAEFYLGRQMTEDEYAKAKKLLEFGTGENLINLFRDIFLELK
jgi:hypothetical protein